MADPTKTSKTFSAVHRWARISPRKARLVGGCLACHTHDAFPEADKFRPKDEIVQGPDLSLVGDKFSSEKGKDWLYT